MNEQHVGRALRKVISLMLYAFICVYALTAAMVITWALNQLIFLAGHFFCSYDSSCTGSVWLLPSEVVDWYALSLGYMMLSGLGILMWVLRFFWKNLHKFHASALRK
jgi:hypothetical protein